MHCSKPGLKLQVQHYDRSGVLYGNELRTSERYGTSPRSGQARDWLAQRIGFETIYDAIYAMPKGALRAEVIALKSRGRRQGSLQG